MRKGTAQERASARLLARATVYAALHASPRKQNERSSESMVADAIAIVDSLEHGRTRKQWIRVLTKEFSGLVESLGPQIEDGREVKSAEERRANARRMFTDAASRGDHETARVIIDAIKNDADKK